MPRVSRPWEDRPQREGIGRAVLSALIPRIEREAPADPYITLLADLPGRPLYAALGFVDIAPTVGMRLARG